MSAGLRSVAIWSPKGGVGKSVLAVALALKLAERQRTVLVDGNADNPDVVSLLQCPGNPNVARWNEKASPDQVESMLVRHSNQLWVLPGPTRYVDEHTLTGPLMGTVISLCLGAGMTVVIDLGTALRDSTIEALDKVDRILVPVTLDLLSVAPLKRIQRELELLRLSHDKFQVVINRLTSTKEITVEDVKRFTSFPIAGVVPSARELAAAINRGEIGVALAGTSPVGQEVARLAVPFIATAVQLPVVEQRKSSNSFTELLRGLRKGGA